MILFTDNILVVAKTPRKLRNNSLKAGLRGSGKIVRIRILFEIFLRIRIRNGSDQFQKIVVESHKIQILPATEIAISSKSLYFGNLFGYKRNLTQNYQIFFQIFCNSENKIEKNS